MRIPFSSDAPISLVLAGLQSIPALTGTHNTGFDFTIYTGDLVSHDPDHQLSRLVCTLLDLINLPLIKLSRRDYVQYTEVRLSRIQSYHIVLILSSTDASVRLVQTRTRLRAGVRGAWEPRLV